MPIAAVTWATLLLSLSLSGCAQRAERTGDHAGSGAPSSLERALTDARARWAAQTVEHYEFTFKAGCFCRSDFAKPVTFNRRCIVPWT